MKTCPPSIEQNGWINRANPVSNESESNSERLGRGITSACDRRGHNHHAVFNVTARLESVVPVIERLRNVAAETNQQKQKRTGLKKLSSHFTVLGCRKFRVRKSAQDLTILGVV